MSASLNNSGQAIGRKGSNTRSRIVGAVERLLDEGRGLPPSLASVARASGISSPTFYLYFKDVADAILAALEVANDDLGTLSALLSRPWSGQDPYADALLFVDAYFRHWKAHSSLLRARNVLADEGDPRFIAARVAASGLLQETLAAKLEPAVASGSIVAEPRDLAGVMLAAIERVATIATLELYPEVPYDEQGSKRALAYQLAILVDGQRRRATEEEA